MIDLLASVLLVTLVLVLLVMLAAGTRLLIKRWRGGSGGSKEQRAEDRDAKRRQRKLRADHSATVKAAAQDVNTASKSYNEAVKAARQNVKTATKSYNQRIDAAQKQLGALQDPRGRKLATFQKHTLYEHAIVTPNGESNLEGVSADVDTAGSLATKSRSTLTRMAAGGLLLGPLGSILSMGFKKNKEIDKRELYLLVDASSASSVVQCPPDEGLKAREFAMKVNSAATAEAAYREQLPGLLEQAQLQLAAAKDATGPVRTAETELASATNDPVALGAIDRAQRQLEAVEGAPPTDEKPKLPPPPGASPPATPPPTSPAAE